MSEIKVNSIKGTGATTAAITIDSSSGGCQANVTNNLSNKNIIINGAMQVAQRGTSNTTNGYGTVDRVLMGYANVDEAPTQSQVDVASGTSPFSLGFRKAFRVTNGNQTSGAGADDYIYFNAQAIEAQNLATSGWNYVSSSSNITLSFWVKSSVAQNFYFQFDVRDGTRHAYAMETGSLTADTWTKVTKVIPGNSNLTIDNDNGVGAYITFGLFWGTNLTSSSVSLNAWGVASDSAKTPDYTSTWYTTNDATFEITGVQLEVSDVATDFEHRSFGQELELCKRYCQQFTSGSGDYVLALANTWTSTQPRFILYLHPEMRAAPTFSTPVGSYRFRNATGNTQNHSGTSASGSDINSKMAVITGSQPQGGLTAGNVGQVRLLTGSDEPGTVRFDAEL